MEPLLFLGFAAAWRWMDRAAVVGAVTAIGTLVKVQPALLAVWAIATGRFRAAALAAGLVVALAAAATLVTGVDAWTTYATLLRDLGGQLSTPHNFAPGAVAHMAGAPDELAAAIQLASAALAVAALLAAWRWAGPELSLQVTIVASQLISSPLRDHYAVLLLLPTAWLIQRGRTWAVVFPLVGWIALFAFGDSTAPGTATAATTVLTSPATTASGSWIAAATVPLAFFACLAVLLWEAALDRRAGRGPAAAAAAAATTPSE